jgi:hypothetical protein
VRPSSGQKTLSRLVSCTTWVPARTVAFSVLVIASRGVLALVAVTAGLP